MVSRFWSRVVQEITPYESGEQPQNQQLIKLNTNENPYPPSRLVLNAMRQALTDNLRLYPDPNCTKLKEAAGQYFRLPTNHIFVGNGSDEILAFCYRAFFNPGEKILFPDITYSFYEVYANMFEISYNTIVLADQFEVPVEEFFRENRGIILANPNAPTGKLLAIESIERILVNNPDSVVIIDEAYIDFGGTSSTQLISSYQNLLVVRTFSKSRSLAGLRVGLALGHPDLIEALDRVKNCFNSYTIDRVALAGAEQSLRDSKSFQANVNRIIHTRSIITNKLRLLGFNVIDSKANFIFITHSGMSAVEILDKLKLQNIYVRHFNKPKIDNYLRVSIGTDQEMEVFYQAIKEIVHRRA